MELRVLNYFLAIAREQSIVHAAESLHLSQPTLSTQIKNLEQELGKQLFIRGTKGTRKVTLTEEGMILRKRAEEILDLVKKAETEIKMSDDVVIGDVYHRHRRDRRHPSDRKSRQKSSRTGIPASAIIFPAEIPHLYPNIWIKG